MSLQQAYSGYALNQTESNDPISKGLTAGSNAYNSGTSKGAYDYLSGQGAYPVSQMPSASYESLHGISGPYSQQGIAQAAKDAPFRGTYTSSQELANRVQTKPGAAASLVNMALPAYVGYKFLMPDPAKDYLASKTGLESLGSGAKAATPAAQTGAATNVATAPEVLGEASGKWAPTTTAPTTAAAPEVLGEASGAWAPTAEATTTSAGISAAAPPLNATAGEIGYIYDSATGSLAPATAEQLAAANISGGTTAAAGTVGTEAAAAEGAASMGGSELATMAAEYGPYIAAAIAADQLLFDGKLSRGIDDAIIQPLGDVVGGIVEGVGDVVGGVVEGAGDIVSDAASFVGDVFGWAEGGPVGGLSAARRYEMGGYLDEERPKLQQYNQLGQKLDKDVSTDYELATTQRNTKKANELKNELAYRARMKKYQGRMATGGIADYNLGGYSDGGRLLKGPGDGVSDSIPATIGKTKQPARLADGEFVVPARIVSELGNGSTEAGARKLYAMMDRIQKSRKKSVGKGKVAVNSRADKHLPA